MGLFRRRRVRATSSDRFVVDLDDVERRVLLDVCEQLQEALQHTDSAPALRRLFPMAHVSEPELEDEYQSMVHDDLRSKRLTDLQVVIDGAEAKELDREALEQWMTAINAVRLVFGTTLDVDEEGTGALDPDDPHTPALVVYHFLGEVLEEIVDSLSTTL